MNRSRSSLGKKGVEWKAITVVPGNRSGKQRERAGIRVYKRSQ
jgi:hypothetical protein